MKRVLIWIIRLLVKWVVGTLLVLGGLKLRRHLIDVMERRPSTMPWMR